MTSTERMTTQAEDGDPAFSSGQPWWVRVLPNRITTFIMSSRTFNVLINASESLSLRLQLYVREEVETSWHILLMSVQ